MNITLDLKEMIYVITVVSTLAGAWAYLRYSTTHNTKTSKAQDERITKLEIKCNDMIEEDKAFKSFVTIDIFHQQNQYMDEKITDIKQQNNTIINLLTKGNK